MNKSNHTLDLDSQVASSLPASSSLAHNSKNRETLKDELYDEAGPTSAKKSSDLKPYRTYTEDNQVVDHEKEGLLTMEIK